MGCAYADSCLTHEQMIMCAYSRGKASLEANLITGMMAAVGEFTSLQFFFESLPQKFIQRIGLQRYEVETTSNYRSCLS